MLIAFDLDDTLMHEMDYVTSAWHEIASTLARKYGVREDAIYSVMAQGENAYDAAVDYLRSLGHDDIPSDRQLVEQYRSHKPAQLPLMEGAAEVISWAQGLGATLAIVTDGRENTQMAKIKALGLAKQIPPGNILISEVTCHDKSEPHNFRYLMEQYPNEERWIYVGDNPAKDFNMPHSLGWITVGLRDQKGRNVHSQQFGMPDSPTHPDYIIDSLSQLPSILLK